jgi:hypothetical protein
MPQGAAVRADFFRRYTEGIQPGALSLPAELRVERLISWSCVVGSALTRGLRGGGSSAAMRSAA